MADSADGRRLVWRRVVAGAASVAALVVASSCVNLNADPDGTTRAEGRDERSDPARSQRPETPRESRAPTPPRGRVADEEAVRRYMSDNFSATSWYGFIEGYDITDQWVEVRTSLYPDADAREPGMSICRAVMQAPHNGDGFLAVRVVGSNGEKVAGNIGFGVGPCEPDV